MKDHLTKWVAHILTKQMVDERHTSMPEYPGMRHFKNRISAVSQWTGHELKEMAKVLLPVMSDANPQVVAAGRAPLDFMYLAHSSSLTDSKLNDMDEVLRTFHRNKVVFKQLGAVTTKRVFHGIPKIHMIQHYVYLIKQLGTPDGYNTETLERLHIDFAKMGYQRSSKVNATKQMALYIQCVEAVAMHKAYLAETTHGPFEWGDEQDENYEDRLEDEMREEDEELDDWYEEDEEEDPDELIDTGVRAELAIKLDEFLSGGKARVGGSWEAEPPGDQGDQGDQGRQYFHPVPQCVLAKTPTTRGVNLEYLEEHHDATKLVPALCSFLHKERPHSRHIQLPPDPRFNIWSCARLFHAPLLFKPSEGPQIDMIRAQPEKIDGFQCVCRPARFDTVMILVDPTQHGVHRYRVGRRIERKQNEYERQRVQQRNMFEELIRMLEHCQAFEEQKLMGSPAVESGSMSATLPLIGGGTLQYHPTMSSPTTHPQANSILQPLSNTYATPDHDIASALSHRLAPGSQFSNSSLMTGVGFRTPRSASHHSLSNTVEKHKSGNNADYAEYTTYSFDTLATRTHTVTIPCVSQFGSYIHVADAKSMPGSVCGYGNHGDSPGINLRGLSICNGGSAVLAVQAKQGDILKNGPSGILGPSMAYPAKGFNPEFELDEEQPSHDMHEDDRSLLQSNSYSKLPALSAALDLAPLSQTPLRSPGPGGHHPALKPSEWPQFSGVPHPSDVRAQPRMQNATNLGPISGSRPSLGLGHNSSSPTDVLGSGAILNPSANNVPTTLMSACQSISNLSVKPVGFTGGDVASFAQEQNSPAFMNRSSGAYDTPVTFNLFVGNINGEGVSAPTFASYDYDPGMHNDVQSGSTALHQYNGSRYSLALGNGQFMPQENKMIGGLHGSNHRRGNIDREFNRFAGTRLEDLVGKIPALCKDQHSCHYLQKKLEQGVPEHRDIIFHETFSLFAELMTDHFSNYLCQKLLEYLTKQQRNMMCESVAHDLVGISLTMHGTRAVQKMIDLLSTQRQANPLSYDVPIHSITMVLSMHIVILIKDLHGNHLVQKCLNRLTPVDNQCIYDAITADCVEVVSHHHGCCIIQRCIDRGTDSQRVQLITEISFNALTLVQDPYGNYVVQYILSLNNNCVRDALIRQFIGNVCAFSVQKYSSNVIEKCIRVATRRTCEMLIDEFLGRDCLEKLLCDSYGNYCTQTALDYATPLQRTLLVDSIWPMLLLLQSTPCGKRIRNRLQREQMRSYRPQFGDHCPDTMPIASPMNNGINMGKQSVPQPLSLHSPLVSAYSHSASYCAPEQSHLSF
ncbi:hypothetical protein FS749_006842 [Ceratobasidium sp. UAMH 11750]|nr:hypothetical protein FS749_006842 [Ceratobasidium sp. UAMH 11750]